MIRDFLETDRTEFIEMAKNFYKSPAVSHNIDVNNFEITFDELMNKNPFMRGFIFENDKEPLGYALITFSYSNEAGGIVILIDEVYLKESARGHGIGHKFFEFIFEEYPDAKRIRLEVTKENVQAMKLYSNLGFKFMDYKQMIKGD